MKRISFAEAGSAGHRRVMKREKTLAQMNALGSG